MAQDYLLQGNSLEMRVPTCRIKFRRDCSGAQGKTGEALKIECSACH